MQNGMAGDFSWERTAGRYIDAYRTAIERKKRVNLASWAERKVEQR